MSDFEDNRTWHGRTVTSGFFTQGEHRHISNIGGTICRITLLIWVNSRWLDSNVYGAMNDESKPVLNEGKPESKSSDKDRQMAIKEYIDNLREIIRNLRKRFH